MSPVPKRTWRRVDGVLLLDKPSGMSSNHALQAARRLFSAEKGGHTGTLDPLATGLLPLCFGEATKFAGELLDADKRYLATVQLGVVTDTADAEGKVLSRHPVDCDRTAIESVVAAFLGEIDQVPPMHSALKRDGKPLYEYARAGIELERPPRRVCIHALAILEWGQDSFVLDVHCSKGTYVRTLAADIGQRLGCGAHLSALRRTAIGGLNIADALAIPALEAMPLEERDASLLPPDALLSRLEAAVLDEADALRLGRGQAVRWQGGEGSRLRVYGPGPRFLGLCRLDADGWLRPQRLVAERTGADRS